MSQNIGSHNTDIFLSAYSSRILNTMVIFLIE